MVPSDLLHYSSQNILKLSESFNISFQLSNIRCLEPLRKTMFIGTSLDIFFRQDTLYYQVPSMVGRQVE